MLVIYFNRYFVLDFETGILQYFMNEQTKNQSPKPRGALSLAGAIISPSDEVPHMLVVYSANGEMYKLRGTLLLTAPAELLFSTPTSAYLLSCLISFTSLCCQKAVAIKLCYYTVCFKTRSRSNLELSACDFTMFRLSGLEGTSRWLLQSVTVAF